MSRALLQYRNVQQLLTDLWDLGFSDAAIARFINCRPETVARVRSGEQSGRNIAQRLLVLADAAGKPRKLVPYQQKLHVVCAHSDSIRLHQTGTIGFLPSVIVPHNWFGSILSRIALRTGAPRDF